MTPVNSSHQKISNHAFAASTANLLHKMNTIFFLGVVFEDVARYSLVADTLAVEEHDWLDAKSSYAGI